MECGLLPDIDVYFIHTARTKSRIIGEGIVVNIV